ncbi:hepatoma-derived growth factor-related protein 2-like [Zerene cesonia]|uniref:hepatoma-derived growth factor-related protein 2-like n=1 Tax=Zerene cesonia TaxID=33412 RepID=UPI0018E5103B|nr:hepatoma-derived growth factor-related protein 2-like [Zerene cesonia]
MSNLESELKDLQERNNELVQKLQHWKVIAAERENEKIKLMKEASELRLKLSMLRSTGTANARKLDTAIQSASEEALSHLVHASNAVARISELAKRYMQDRENQESVLPRWSNLSNTPSSEKVHRVPPMMLGGKSIQPVVSLSRTLFAINNSNTWPESRTPNTNLNGLRPMPMHMLQDVYIPLTRIDAEELNRNNGATEENVNNSADELGLNDSDDRIIEEEPDVSESEQLEDSRRLHVVTEESEETEITPERSRLDNPLEGPSWLLDEPNNKVNMRRGRNRMSIAPDIMEYDEMAPNQHNDSETESAFPPEVRKRASSPRPAPAAAAPAPATPRSPVFSPRRRRYSNNGRVLKVLVAKMRLDEDDEVPAKRPMMATPQNFSPRASTSQDSKTHFKQSFSKRRDSGSLENQSPVVRARRSVSRERANLSRELDGSGESPDGSQLRRLERIPSFDAPSPNGSTDARVIVSESTEACEHVARRVKRNNSNTSNNSNSEPASDSSSELLLEARTRRARKPIVYKEKPLNRKLRR